MIKLKNILREILQYRRPNETPSTDGTHWWLSPDVKFYNMAGRSHMAWGHNYLIKTIGVNPHNSLVLEDVYTNMFKLGWIRVALVDMLPATDDVSRVMEYDYLPGKLPTNSQLRALKNLAIEKEADRLIDGVSHQIVDLNESVKD